MGTEYTRRTGYDITGRDGVKLSEYWAEGMRTKHGIHVHGFPNLFIVQPTQGANLISNVPHNLTEAGRTIALDRSSTPSTAATTRSRSPRRPRTSGSSCCCPVPAGAIIGSPDCTPGYYNNEGQPPGPASNFFVGYPYGPTAYFAYIDQWRSSGEFEGLEFR